MKEKELSYYHYLEQQLESQLQKEDYELSFGMTDADYEFEEYYSSLSDEEKAQFDEMEEPDF